MPDALADEQIFLALLPKVRFAFAAWVLGAGRDAGAAVNLG